MADGVSVEASTPRVYWRVTLASTNTFSESEDFNLRSDDVLSRCVELWPRTMEKGLGESV